MIDTKLEAFKLANDPLHLISLLYSKYVDIQEDYLLLISNQLVYNKQSLYLINGRYKVRSL